jgi:threonyl-tRNA synthetase
MRGFVNKKLPFTGREVSPRRAQETFCQQPFKLDLINDFTGKGEPGKEKEKLTVYETGRNVFMDLCRGGHVENTSEIPADGFKLDKIAGAYWRGDEKNQQLQRIYGLAFESKEALKRI